MKTIEFERFEEFMPWVESNLGKHELLFRGQSNAEWKLETTLERFIGKDISLKRYYQRVLISKPQIETYLNDKWDIPEYPDYEQWLNECRGDSIHFSKEFKGYEFMAYLRHHGFPSPLLDWSRSPFIAAFFAFRYATKGKASIFAYCEYPNLFKTGQSGRPLIRVLGPYIKCHKRHFQQQSQYTICAMVQPPSNSGDCYYADHESIFSNSDDEQDALWKFTFPVSERGKVFKSLNHYNLNAYSLFGSEESLCETVAFNAFAKEL
jgi:hypothetical protein